MQHRRVTGDLATRPEKRHDGFLPNRGDLARARGSNLCGLLAGNHNPRSKEHAETSQTSCHGDAVRDAIPNAIQDFSAKGN